MAFIQAHKLCKTYFGKKKHVKHALESATLNFYEGEVLSLLGINGAGKTTFISLLATLHPPTSGDIQWQGSSIYDNLLSYRSILGLCPQQPNLDPNLSLEETLVFAGRCYGLTKTEAIERKNQLLKQLMLEPYKTAIPSILSGGYRQRFLIARAVMHKPKFLILDEPTVGLDASIRRDLWQVIRDLKDQGISILITTHYLEEAESLSDRVCLIHDGKIRASNTVENLKKIHKKDNLEGVFLKFVEDPNAEIFNSETS